MNNQIKKAIEKRRQDRLESVASLEKYARITFEDNRKLQKAIQSLCDQMIDHKPDTSDDGISFIENEEGACVQIISNGSCVLMYINMFELLLLKEKR